MPPEEISKKSAPAPPAPSRRRSLSAARPSRRASSRSRRSGRRPAPRRRRPRAPRRRCAAAAVPGSRASRRTRPRGGWRGGEELVQQVAVRGVQFQDAEAGVHRAARGGAEVGDDPVDAVVVELGRGVQVAERDRRRCHGRPAALRGRDRAGPVLEAPGRPGGALPARVGELDARDRALLGDKGGDGPPRFGLFVRPDAGVARGDTPLRADCGRFGEDDAAAAGGDRTEVDELPGLRDARAVQH